MVLLGREVRSQTEYILGSSRWIFQNISARYSWHNSDHVVVMGCMCGASPRKNSRYLGRRTLLPLKPPGRQTRTRADKIFAGLHIAVPNPSIRSAHHNLWIEEETWRLIDERVSVRGELGRCQAQPRWMGRAIRAALKVDRRRQVERVGNDMEQLFTGDTPLLR